MRLQNVGGNRSRQSWIVPAIGRRPPRSAASDRNGRRIQALSEPDAAQRDQGARRITRRGGIHLGGPFDGHGGRSLREGFK